MARNANRSRSSRSPGVSLSRSRGRSRTPRAARGSSTLWSHFDQPMASVSRSRSRSVARGASVTSAKRVSFNSIKPSGGDMVAVSAKRKKSVKQTGVKKKVATLSRPLKEAVKNVFKAPEVRGVYRNIKYQLLATGGDNAQNVYTVQNATVDSVTGGMFMPSDILHAASVMWNGKSDSTTRAYNDSGNFNSKNVKIRVVNSYVQHTIRNNGQGEVRYSVYTCAPKDKGLDGGVPSFVWDKAYTTAFAAGSVNSGLSIYSLGERPTKFKSFNDQYKSSVEQFVLAPGQTKTWSTQGPKDFEIDYTGNWLNDTEWATSSKYCRFVFIVIEGPVTIATDGKVGRFTDLTSTSPYGTALENRTFYKLAMPEQTGFTYPGTFPVTTTQQVLNNRIDKYYSYQYGDSQGSSNPIVNTDQENPTNPETSAKI